MGQIVETRKLYKETIQSITKTEKNWITFLDSISWHFKYDFVDQILIYAQRPDAKACAELKEWNEKVHRWVNKDAKFIFVLSKDENSQYPFRLVFDVSDTHNYKNTPYKLWEVKPEYEEKIIETLETAFGGACEADTLAENIIANAYTMVTDNIQDYLSTIHEYKKGTVLENLSDNEIHDIALLTVWASVSYMMMTRCGINAKEKITIQEFSFIKDFNNDKIITALGTAISDIAEMGLREIAKTVINLQNEEKKINHTFVKKEKQEYSNNKEIIKGGTENGENRIQASRGLSNTKSSNGEREDTRWQIRKNEVTLSNETQESRLFDIIDGQKLEQRIDENTRTGNGNGKTDSGEISTTRGDNRGIESTRPNEMDRANEQLQSDSRGTDNERTNLQLENKNLIVWVAEFNSKVKTFDDDETIDNILKNAPNVIKAKEPLEVYFKFNDRENSTDYIQKILGNAYTEYYIDNDIRVGYKSYENGLYMWKGDYLNRTEGCFKTWDEITDYFLSDVFLQANEDIAKELPSENEQRQSIAEVENTSVFSFSQEEIDNALIIGSGVVNGKFRIYEYLTRGLSTNENAEFLKQEYGIGGTSENEDGISKWYDSKGITLTKGHKDNAPTLKLTWKQVEKRIRELISIDRYLSELQKDEYYDWLDANGIATNNEEKQVKDEDYKLAERLHNYLLNYDIVSYHNNFSLDNTIEQNIELLQADINDEKNIKEYIDFLKESYKDLDYDDETSIEARSLLVELEKRLPYYEFHNGDIVYIATQEYEIRAIDEERVVLADTAFPLFTKEMQRDEFDRKVKENPANDKLRTGKRIEDKIINTQINSKQENDSFNKWLDTFIDEKGIDLDETFTIEDNGQLHIFEIGNVIENIKATTKEEQQAIKDMIIKIDFNNADVIDYFKHLAKALVNNYQQEIEQVDKTEIPKVETLAQRLHQFLNDYDVYDVDEVTMQEVEDTLKDTQKIEDTIEYFNDMLQSEDILDEFSIELRDFIEELDSIKDSLEKQNSQQENLQWLDTLVAEKRINLDETFTIDRIDISYTFQIRNAVEYIKAMPIEEQYNVIQAIKRINEDNGDIIKYLKILVGELIDRKVIEFPEQKVIREKLQKEYEDTFKANIKRKRRNKIEYFDLHPEIPIKDRFNYVIKNNDLGIGTKKEKYRNNIEAIKVLKLCEEENRYATPEEQEILAQYVGWGGLQEAFNSRIDSWNAEYKELKSLLTEKEYTEARKTVLTAFYTPPIVIKSIYKALENMGLERGNILEPSCRNR